MRTDYRRPGRTYATAFNAVRALLHFVKLRFAKLLSQTLLSVASGLARSGEAMTFDDHP
jgi:hypothetical protein